MNLVERLRTVPKVTCTPDPEGSTWKLMTGKYCHDAADRIESLEQLAKDMAEALEEIRNEDANKTINHHCDVALSRYREVCGGEK